MFQMGFYTPLSHLTPVFVKATTVPFCKFLTLRVPRTYIDVVETKFSVKNFISKCDTAENYGFVHVY